MTFEPRRGIARGVPELRVTRIVVYVYAASDSCLQHVDREMTAHVHKEFRATCDVFELAACESVHGGTRTVEQSRSIGEPELAHDMSEEVDRPAGCSGLQLLHEEGLDAQALEPLRPRKTGPRIAAVPRLVRERAGDDGDHGGSTRLESAGICDFC